MGLSDCLHLRKLVSSELPPLGLIIFFYQLQGTLFSPWVDSPLFPPHLGSFPSTWFWGRQISFHKSPYSLFLVGVEILTYYHCSEFGNFLNLGLLGLFLFPLLELVLKFTLISNNQSWSCVHYAPCFPSLSWSPTLIPPFTLDAPSSAFSHSSTS